MIMYIHYSRQSEFYVTANPGPIMDDRLNSIYGSK